MKIEKFLKISPFFAVQDTFNSLSQFLLTFFKEEDVNLLQGFILVSLLFEEEESIHPGLLVKVFKTSKSSISQAISELESKSLIKRVLADEDARSYKIILTAKGMKVANRISAILDQIQSKWEKLLGENRLKDVILGLNDIQSVTKSP